MYNPYYPNFNYNLNSNQTKTNLTWIDVDSATEVDNINIQPNSQAWIRFRKEPIIAVKTADGLGISKTEFFEVKKIDLNLKNNNSSFVTKDEFSKAIKDLEKIIIENKNVEDKKINKSKEKN